MAKYSHRSACVLRTEAPGRHSTYIRLAESEARLAIGFLVVDNSGPAAADSEFAASVIDAVAPADEAMFTADVAVDDPNEISQDSSCMLAHSKGTFRRVVHFRINTTPPAVGLSRVPQQTTETTPRIIWYHMFVSWLHEPEKQNATIRTRT